MKRLTINAYTASGAVRIVRQAVRENFGKGITNVTATLRPKAEWVPDSQAAAYETTDHVGQKNATYDVTFDVSEGEAR